MFTGKDIGRKLRDCGHAPNLEKGDAIVKEVFESIKAALASGDEVQIQGFGKFKVGKVAAREGRNPQTGESLTIGEGKRVNFKPSPVLKSAL